MLPFPCKHRFLDVHCSNLEVSARLETRVGLTGIGRTGSGENTVTIAPLLADARHMLRLRLSLRVVTRRFGLRVMLGVTWPYMGITHNQVPLGLSRVGLGVGSCLESGSGSGWITLQGSMHV